MSDVTITLFSDPLSPAAYRRRAVRSQLEYVFDDVEFRYRCVVSVPEATDDVFSEVADELSDLRSASTMPVADSLTAEDLPSSWAACEAIAAARAYSGADAAFALARALADRTFAAGEPVNAPGAIHEAATAAGVDAERVVDAVGSRRAAAAVGRDLEGARQTVSDLKEFEVRGTPETAPLRPRSYLDDVDDGRDAGTNADTEDDSDTNADTDADINDETDTNDDADEGSEPTTNEVFRAPVYRVDGPARTIVVDGAAGFDAVRDAVRTQDPELGDLGDTTGTQSRNVMQQYGTSPMNAESFSPEDHGERAVAVLSTLKSAFTPEIRACLDVTEETCRITLHRLKRDGDVRQLTTGSWARVPEE